MLANASSKISSPQLRDTCIRYLSCSAGAPDAAAGPSQPGAGDAAPSSAKKIKPPAAGAAGGAGGEEGAGPSAPKRKEAKKTAEGDAVSFAAAPAM